MTLHPIASEFPNITGNFYFLFYQRIHLNSGRNIFLEDYAYLAPTPDPLAIAPPSLTSLSLSALCVTGTACLANW